jgi:hypothetical protein
MVYPRNNFATDAKYWGREVEKKITNLESSLQSSDINNTTRDSQLSVTAGQALIAANDAKAASDDASAAAAVANNALGGLVSLGADGSTYDINGGNITANTITATEISSAYVYAGTVSANNITAGTITGSTLQTAASGQRIDIETNTIDIWNSGNVKTGSIYGSSYGGNNATYISGGACVLASTAGNYLVGQTGVYGASFSSENDIVAVSGSLTRNALIGGGTTGASVTNGGNFVRTSSSRRYKTDIEDAEFGLDAVLQLQPKTFRLKEEVEEDPENAIRYPGLIAEDIAGTTLDIFVNYETLKDGTRRPDGVRYSELTAALVSAMKQQNTTIKTLEARLDALEAE